VALQPKPFTLDTVLNYRKRLEDLAKNRFFEARNIHTIISDKLQSEKKALTALIEETEKLQAEGVEIRKLILFEEKITASQKNVIAIEKNLQEKAKIVEQEQKNLLKRSRERQIMDRLKIEQNVSWQRYLDKKEAAMLDEIAIIRHGKDPLDQK
jgi:flagellar FliJ protein